MRALLGAVVAGLAMLPAGAGAQTEAQAGVPAARECQLRVDPGGLTRREGSIVDILDPFRVICNDGANLRALSGTFDQLARVVTLTGEVFFEDPTRTLTSDRAVYDNSVGMLHATGNVVFTDRVEGTTLTGPELEYYRANEQRSEALVNAFGRPRLTLRRLPSPEEDGGAESPAEPISATTDTSGAPLTIDADRMTIEGRNDLTAVGNVVIEDDDLRALADEAEQRGSSETLELRGNAAIHSREYSLEAETIFATTPDGSIREVEARRNARLLGADLDVEAPQLDLLFEENLLQRSIARSDSALAPGVQPLASSATFRLQADSIDASLPGQRLETVVAIGNARGETIDTTQTASDVADDPQAPIALADSLDAGESGNVAGQAEPVAARFESGDSVTTVSGARLIENDWITGDTITGYFATVVSSPVDSVAEGGDVSLDGEAAEGAPATEGLATTRSDTSLVMERLVAVGAARSLYHVAPEEGSPPGTQRGVNFLSAAQIELQFADGEVQVADVIGLRRGLYLDPIPPGATPAASSDEAGALEGPQDPAGELDGADREEPVVPEPGPQDSVPDAAANAGGQGE